MAWLVRSTALDPKLQPKFSWIAPPKKYYEGWQRAVRRDPDSIPRTARRKGRSKSPLPGFFMLDGPMVVCAAFRDMVEALEPGMHEFHAIVLLDKDGKELAERFYILNILVKLDVLVIDKSDVNWGLWREIERQDGSFIRTRTLHLDHYPKKLFARRETIDGHHLWRGDEHLSTMMFMSDVLMAAIEHAGLKGLDAYQMVEE